MIPQLQKAGERFCGEPLPDHLHNKAIERRGLTPTPTPGPLRYNAPGPHFPPRSPQRPRPRPASTSRSPKVPSEHGMPSRSSPPSPSSALEPLTRRMLPGPCRASVYWSLNLTDPGSVFWVLREPFSRAQGSVNWPNPPCNPPRGPSFPRPQHQDHTQDSVLSEEEDRDTPGASGLLLGHSSPKPTLPGFNATTSWSPPPDLHPHPLQGSSRPHTQAMIPAGVLLSRTSCPTLQGSPHLHTLGSGPLHKLRSPQPTACLSQLPLGFRLCAHESPQPGFLPSWSPCSPSSWGRRARTQATAPLTFSRRWWRPRTSPAATTDPSVSVPNPPLPPPGSFSTAARACPTHSHPHWASSTPITAAPRPTGPFARPSPRKDVSNPNEATFPSPAPSTHLE